ncbi:uncharacterized protein Pyn_19042 [Prunus yedoensis var. nudiflora]|uniref:DUF4283 domain-containing protein n=1 Tax=Prunus yedoensis var. nudiflora TaxID=2094558 RepID=A0A314ZPH5_PRUYE|nr:uncharacterized protein Pyn_19042 [Prunus yedoensis var. nudiflora]
MWLNGWVESELEAADQFTIHLENNLGLTEDRCGVTLAGFLITEKEPQIGGVKNALQREWRNIVHSNDVKIAWASPNVYIITAASTVVAKKLIEKGPWHVNDDVFSIQPWPQSSTLAEIHPNKATYWIQAHGIPLGLMTGRNARLIGERIGTVIGVEDPATNGTRSFLWMRIVIDATKPLQLGFWLPRANEGRTWINLKYEGLRRFCFRCGRLGHANLLGNPCVRTLDTVVAHNGMKYDAELAVRATRGPSPLFPVRHPRSTPFSQLVEKELPGKRMTVEDVCHRPNLVPWQSAVSLRPVGIARANRLDNADHLNLDGGQHAGTVPNGVMGLHPVVNEPISNSMAIITHAFSPSAPAIGRVEEALGVPNETNYEALNTNPLWGPANSLACVRKDPTHDGESEIFHAVVKAVALHKPTSLSTESDNLSRFGFFETKQ